MLKVFLGDLVHTWEKVSVWTMPLNIGYVAAYASQHLPDNVEFRLFKCPERMIEAIKTEKPDVVGLSYYVWNTNLNHRVFEVVKEHAPHALAVGGGPHFTNLNAKELSARTFFAAQPECDVFAINQGERPFLEVLKAFLEHGRDVDRLRRGPIPGTLVNDLADRDRVHVGEALDAIRDLDEIPSPYLNGMIDEFFDGPFIPIIETNRSCPYRCTFCAWGIGTGKLVRFSEERVLSEIDYIAERCTETANMYIADANFSILERDAGFARRMYECHRDKGYPAHVMVQWNKSRPDRVLRTAKAFNGITEVGASMQSLSDEVLKAIKRRNLSLDAIKEIQEELRESAPGSQLFSELIVGLPLETWQSHIDANKALIDLDAEVFNYNLHLLPGTEMDTPDARETYFKRTGWRLHDNAFGIYDGKKVLEGQEVVLETSTMSMVELGSFRFIHFLIQFMWGRKWYYDFLMLLKEQGLHPVDVILKVVEKFKADDGDMGRLYEDFQADHGLEQFDTFEALAEYWNQDEPFERLRNGSYGKLNYLYTYRILLEHHEIFNRLLSALTTELFAGLEIADEERLSLLDQSEDVIRFSETLRIQLTENLSLVESQRANFNFDILAWKSNGSKGRLLPHPKGRTFEYEFFLSKLQRDSFGRQLNQFNFGNINAAFRKMSEDTSADQFFYQVREVNNPNYRR